MGSPGREKVSEEEAIRRYLGDTTHAIAIAAAASAASDGMRKKELAKICADAMGLELLELVEEAAPVLAASEAETAPITLPPELSKPVEPEPEPEPPKPEPPKVAPKVAPKATMLKRRGAKR